MPNSSQSELIHLFENRDKHKWDNPADKDLQIEWEVIKEDEKRDGYAEQREFVEKALNTPDFAILEGPPGSGKTTVILELICQIIKMAGGCFFAGQPMLPLIIF